MASSSIGRQQRHHADHGIPPRLPTASTPLWTHLLRTNTSSQAPSSLNDMTIIAPPMAPLDKNATSMRVLLHDTQVNFEKFTTHVGTLLENITETRTELKSMHSMFEREREGLVGDIIDLVNRSQVAVQKTLGEPCQASTVEIQFKDVNNRLEGLDQRLDALQAFNQTHSQALQTQIQAVQILLDKQGSIMTAVLPLLPLLQALPLYIESAKNTLVERISEIPWKRSLEDATPPASPSAPRKRRRTDADARPDHGDSPSRPHKRSRSTMLEQNHTDLPSSDTLSIAQLSSAPQNLAKPVDSSSSSASSAGRSSPTPSTTTKAVGSASKPRASKPGSALTTPRRPLRDLQIQNHDPTTNEMIQIRTPSLSSSRRNGENLQPLTSGLTRTGSKTTSTPARVTSSSIFGPNTATHRLYAHSTTLTSPNAALMNAARSIGAQASPFSTSGKTSMYARTGSLAGSTSSPMQRPLFNQSSPQVSLGITPTASRPPRMLRMHASIQGGAVAGTASSSRSSSSTALKAAAVNLSSHSAVSNFSSDFPAQPVSNTGSLSGLLPNVSPRRFTEHSRTAYRAETAISVSEPHPQVPLATNTRDMPPPNQPVGPRPTPMRHVPSRSTTPALSMYGGDIDRADQQSGSGSYQQGAPQRQSTRIRASLAPPSRPASAMSVRSQNAFSTFPSGPGGVPTRAHTPAIGALGRQKEATVPKEGRRFIPLIDSDDEDEGNAGE